MRPGRPLGFGPRERAKRTKWDQRLRRPPRITIDMLKHGSVHLQGIFVDVGLSRVPAPSTSFGRHATVDDMGNDGNDAESSDARAFVATLTARPASPAASLSPAHGTSNSRRFGLIATLLMRIVIVAAITIVVRPCPPWPSPLLCAVFVRPCCCLSLS